MFPLHNLDEVVDNTNNFGFLRAVFDLQHVAKFWYQKLHKRQVEIYRVSAAMVRVEGNHFLYSSYQTQHRAGFFLISLHKISMINLPNDVVL